MKFIVKKTMTFFRPQLIDYFNIVLTKPLVKLSYLAYTGILM